MSSLFVILMISYKSPTFTGTYGLIPLLANFFGPTGLLDGVGDHNVFQSRGMRATAIFHLHSKHVDAPLGALAANEAAALVPDFPCGVGNVFHES